jgi:flavin-dependent dehydrogenase
MQEEHAALHHVALETTRGRQVTIPIGRARYGEIAIKRELLDNILLIRAGSLGAHLRIATPLRGLRRRTPGWELTTPDDTISAKFLVAADGRNSSVARFLKMHEVTRPARVAVQTHAPLPESLQKTVLLKLLPHGYCGAAPVNDSELNLCLVSTPDHIDAVKEWAGNAFPLDTDPRWRSITPLRRDDLDPAHGENLFFIGDAARVVEPFTGEGTYYAMRSGKLAADAVAELSAKSHSAADILAAFRGHYDELYRGRLWINRLARYAVTHPRLGDTLLNCGASFPFPLRWLTSRIIRPIAREPLAATEG